MSRRLLLVVAALVFVGAFWRNRASVGTLLSVLALGGAAGAAAALADGFARPLRARGTAGRVAAGAIVVIAAVMPLLVLIVLGVELRPR
jgi:uncharacterized membrane-anchored protein